VIKKLDTSYIGQKTNSERLLEHSLCDCTPISIYEYAKQQMQLESETKQTARCTIEEDNSYVETQALWQKRLQLLQKSEKELNNATRLRKIAGILTVTCLSTLVFSLFTAPTIPPMIFYGLLLVAVTGLAIYPICFIASKSAMQQRDNISRLFYKSNYEVEVTDDGLTLINRANYASVTKLNVVDRSFGQSAT